ncbi:hypothetical protein [Kingella potus]|uniref:hypothetical protein n=1 Tax=Kingella potus TaxID=265175 RepID=UPI001FD454BF|nr:hypothetical protein [Kingella potus]UOP01593.1 hypothetical protein LVJ84_05300 [Kingella potus]
MQRSIFPPWTTSASTASTSVCRTAARSRGFSCTTGRLKIVFRRPVAWLHANGLCVGCVAQPRTRFECFRQLLARIVSDACVAGATTPYCEASCSYAAQTVHPAAGKNGQQAV